MNQQETRYREAPATACFCVSFLLGALLLFGQSGTPALAEGGAQSDAGRLTVSVAEGRLSLEAEDVPLAEVLQTIGEEAGFAVELRSVSDRDDSGDRVDLEPPVDTGIGDLQWRLHWR